MINIGTILFLIVNVPVLFQCCDPPRVMLILMSFGSILGEK